MSYNRRLNIHILFYVYWLTAYIREQALVTVFGYKSECKHRPTCSVYTHQCISEMGVMRGSWAGFKRIITCW